MKNSFSLRVSLAVLSALLLSAGATAALAQGPNSNASERGQEMAAEHAASAEHSAKVCDRGAGENAGCHARVVVENDGVTPKAAPAPAGFGPAQFHSAYQLLTTVAAVGTALPIIAIVDAYDHPTIQNDLNTYSAQFGIPSLPPCSVAAKNAAGPCFQKVDQRGGTKYPAANAGWALEIALDVETAHAVCQNCKIILVEADSNSFANLMAAVDRARLLGATAISNSYGASEFSGETAYDFHFNYPGIAFTVSSGDNGFGTEYPASSNAVVAVGGTSLVLNANGSIQNETAWAGAGSGCSLYESKPSWQHDTGCTKRSVADVSAVADPATGAAVYDSVKLQGKSGWFKVGGTSLSAPLIAGVFALGGVSSAASAPSLPYTLGSVSTVNDILSGSNGSCGTYLCKAFAGYDGPTGLGTPKGLGAF